MNTSELDIARGWRSCDSMQATRLRLSLAAFGPKRKGEGVGASLLFPSNERLLQQCHMKNDAINLRKTFSQLKKSSRQKATARINWAQHNSCRNASSTLICDRHSRKEFTVAFTRSYYRYALYCATSSKCTSCDSEAGRTTISKTTTD